MLQTATEDLSHLLVTRDRRVLKKFLFLCKQLSTMEVLFSSQGSFGDSFPVDASDLSEMWPAARGMHLASAIWAAAATLRRVGNSSPVETASLGAFLLRMA